MGKVATINHWVDAGVVGVGVISSVVSVLLSLTHPCSSGISRTSLWQTSEGERERAESRQPAANNMEGGNLSTIQLFEEQTDGISVRPKQECSSEVCGECSETGT